MRSVLLTSALSCMVEAFVVVPASPLAVPRSSSPLRAAPPDEEIEQITSSEIPVAGPFVPQLEVPVVLLEDDVSEASVTSPPAPTETIFDPLDSTPAAISARSDRRRNLWINVGSVGALFLGLGFAALTVDAGSWRGSCDNSWRPASS